MKNYLNSYHKKESGWVKVFIVSHMVGYLLSWIQTLWIIGEIRKDRRQ